MNSREYLYKIYCGILGVGKVVYKRLLLIYNGALWLLCRQPMVCSIDETLDHIIESKCSVSRFGDGEYHAIFGNSTGFQMYDKELSARLQEVLNTPVDNHIVCLPDIFANQQQLRAESRKINNTFLSLWRHKVLRCTPINRTYYNAFFTRCYNMFLDKSRCKDWFDKNKRIWENESVLLIEGCKSRLGVGNDLFANVKDLQRILVPAENAFSKYDAILEAAKKHAKGKLVLLAIGMSATVLAFDLAKAGYRAVDIGHIDIEYEWFLRKTTEKTAIPNKYVNEVKGGNNVGVCTDSKYCQQIIEDISN